MDGLAEQVNQLASVVKLLSSNTSRSDNQPSINGDELTPALAHHLSEDYLRLGSSGVQLNFKKPLNNKSKTSLISSSTYKPNSHHTSIQQSAKYYKYQISRPAEEEKISKTESSPNSKYTAEEINIDSLTQTELEDLKNRISQKVRGLSSYKKHREPDLREEVRVHLANSHTAQFEKQKREGSSDKGYSSSIQSKGDTNQ